MIVDVRFGVKFPSNFDFGEGARTVFRTRFIPTNMAEDTMLSMRTHFTQPRRAYRARLPVILHPWETPVIFMMVIPLKFPKVPRGIVVEAFVINVVVVIKASALAVYF